MWGEDGPGFWRIAPACLAGLGVIYALGLPYMALIVNVYMHGGMSPGDVLWSGMVIFLPYDAVKIVLTGLLAQKSNKQMEAEKRTVQGELHAAEMRLELLPKLLKNLYEDKVSGRMQEEDYAILSREYAESENRSKRRLKAHRDRLRRIEQSEGEREQFIKAIRKLMEMRMLTNQILRELIDHIDVYEVAGRGKNRTQRMVIYYKFVGYLEIPSHLSAPNYKADLRQGVAVEYVSCEPTESARELFDEDCEPVEEEK